MRKFILVSIASAFALLQAAPLTVPATVVTDLTTTAENIGGSALTVWGGIALAVLGLVIFRKVFR